MKIAVNTRLLLKNRLEGIGWFIYEHSCRMARQHPEHEFYFLFDRPYDESFIFEKNVHPVVVAPQTRHPVLQYWWFEKAVPRVLKKIQPDLFVSPDNYNSLRAPYRNLLVIHDLNFEHFPHFLQFRDRWFLRRFVPQYAKKADLIVTVSQYSKQDIMNTYGIPDEKIDVIHNGAHASYTAVAPEQQKATRQRYTDGKPYFVYVGALNPRKNIHTLLKAFDLYKEQTQTETQLVLVGETMFESQKTEEALLSMIHREAVIFTGRLEPETLHLVVGSALALTYVPLFEGFGIPVVEAFKAGTPVISSNTTSIPEVAGDAAILTNPNDVPALADAMKKITFDENLRQTLIQKGKERGAAFSWDTAAEKFWESVEKALKRDKS